MNEQDKIVLRFATIPSYEWRVLAMKASWFYRSGGTRPIPAKVLAGFGGETPDKATWDVIRVAVSTKRKKLRYDAVRYEIEQKTAARRAYMRNYMKARRRADKGALV